MQDNRVVNATLTAGGGGFLAWLSTLDLSQLSYVIGIAVAVIGLLLSLFFQWRKDRRDTELHKATLRALATKGVSLDGDSE